MSAANLSHATGHQGAAGLGRRTVLAGLLGAFALRPRDASAFIRQLDWPQALASRPRHAPRPSDVCFSSRWPRPRDARDPHDTLAAARAFQANRLDWCYTEDRGFIQRAKAAGMATVGGTLNSVLPDQPGGTERLRGRVADRNGRLLQAPWMPWPGRSWGCASSPEFRAAWLAHATLALEAGIDWLQMDDPRLNAEAVRWGGCWCEHCTRLARAERLSLERDMPRIARIAVDRFYDDVFAELARRAGRRVTMGSNNSRGRTGWPFDKFDIGMGEVHPDTTNPRQMAELFGRAEEAGRPQIVTLVTDDLPLYRRAIAWSYACAGHVIAPWDIWPGPQRPDAPRLFTRPEETVDLYAFARRLGRALDGAAPVSVHAPGEGPVRMPSGEPWVTVRADPNRRFVVVHLVRWDAGTAGPVQIDRGALPRGTPANARLLEPGGRVVPLTEGARGVMTAVAAPSPWAVVVFGDA